MSVSPIYDFWCWPRTPTPLGCTSRTQQVSRTTSPPCFLLELPAEVRLLIYEHFYDSFGSPNNANWGHWMFDILHKAEFADTSLLLSSNNFRLYSASYRLADDVSYYQPRGISDVRGEDQVHSRPPP